MLATVLTSTLITLGSDSGASVLTSAGNFCGNGACFGVAATPTGDVFVANHASGQISEFDPSDNMIATWGSKGSGAGQLTDPTQLALDQQGNVYVADENGVQEFSSAGTYIQRFSSGIAAGVALDAAGNVFVYSDFPGTITEYSSSATVLRSWSDPGACSDSNACEGASLSYDPLNGDIDVASPNNDDVEMFSGTGTYLGSFGSPGDGSGQFGFPYGIAFDSSGNVYVSDPELTNAFGSSDIRVQEFSSSGSYIGSFQTSAQPFGLAVADGNLYVADGRDLTTIGLEVPVASISGPTSSPFATEIATFSGSGSFAPFGSVTDYSWTLSGSTSESVDTGSSPTFSPTLANSGPLTVQLTVTSSYGTTATTTSTLDVGDAPPTPPPGVVGVSIDDGAYATGSASVTLDLVWPAGATSALISNDGGFDAAGSTATLTLGDTVPWTLERTGSDRLPKTVYVRYLGAGVDLITFSDSIILDERRPSISEASLVRTTGGIAPRLATGNSQRSVVDHHYAVHIVATDKFSGIAAAQVSPERHGGAMVRIRPRSSRGVLRLSRTLTIQARTAPQFVRVSSGAGRWSAWYAIAG